MKVKCKHCGKLIEINPAKHDYEEHGYCAICESYVCASCSREHLIRLDNMSSNIRNEFKYVCDDCMTDELYKAHKAVVKAYKALVKANEAMVNAERVVIALIEKEATKC